MGFISETGNMTPSQSWSAQNSTDAHWLPFKTMGSLRRRDDNSRSKVQNVRKDSSGTFRRCSTHDRSFVVVSAAAQAAPELS
jgi:hypothetical protein